MSTTLSTMRSVGRSAVMIPPIALGCGNFGGVGSAPEFFGQGLDDDEALELMDAAWEFGITHFDTADAYGGGRSELAIGRWIQSRGVTPLLTTKTFNPMQAGADSGLRPERITRQLHASLERLAVDHVDLYLAHEFDPDVPLPESFAALDEACAGSARIVRTTELEAGPADELVLTGGWSHLAGLRERKRRLLSRARWPEVVEAGARGAALFGGCAAGLFSGPYAFPKPRDLTWAEPAGAATSKSAD